MLRCLQELSKDGSSSDPDSGFTACVTYNGAAVDLTRGNTQDLVGYGHYGESIGWTEKGYQPSSAALWAYAMFWSNATTTAAA